MSNNEKGAVLPRRNREAAESVSVSQISPEQQKIIEQAPLHTSASHQTTPAVEKAEDKEQVKAWREGVSMSPDELKSVTEKQSYNIPLDTRLKLDFVLAQDKKNKILGKKTNKTMLVVEALEDYLNKRLKQLGHDPKD
ncbi:hypothetical protein [Acinetobacter ursingii]|uniref:hypothetical protein n=1 Tax=Acinetobacter ursingii TaxID=108980 RepID=UPI00124F90BC|nr:hypothetical protein [Acinetobacter ursingii]